MKKYIKENFNKGYTLKNIKKALIIYNYDRLLVERLIRGFVIKRDIARALPFFSLLILIIFGFLYFKPTIVGYITISQEINYTDTIDLAADVNREYYWFLTNPGDLKSIRLDGSITTNGTAKAYVEHNNRTYLIFDSTQLETSLPGITGAVVANETLANDTNIPQLQSPTTQNEAANETSQTNAAEITPSATSSTNQKNITINLSYNPGTLFDADDDGVETTKGVIDLTVENTAFNWQVEQSKLCTKWEVYSEENKTSEFRCYGNENCCAFIDVQAKTSDWKEIFFSNYEKQGATLNNVIAAQVIYYNVSLDPENLYAEIITSDLAHLDAKYYFEETIFTDQCIETCLLDGFNESMYKLIIEVNNSVLTISNIKYSILNVTNVTEENITIELKDKQGRKLGKSKLTKTARGNHDLDITEKRNKINIKEIKNLNQLKKLDAYIDDTSEDEVKTTVFAVDETILIDNAEITLTKKGAVNTILYCSNFDSNLFSCVNGWQKTDIPFSETANTITFIVSHFTAYAGGYYENVTGAKTWTTLNDFDEGNYYNVSSNATGLIMLSLDNSTNQTENLSTSRELSADTNTVLLMHFNNDSAVGENYNNSEDYVVYDYSGAGNNGTAWANLSETGPQFTTNGKFGGTLDFDGNDDFIKILHSDSLNLTTALTLEAWIKFTNSTTDSTQAIISKYDRTLGRPFALHVANSGGITFYLNNSEKCQNPTNEYLEQNKWYHVAGTWDGTDVACYINGINVSNTRSSTFSGVLENLGTNVTIGMDVVPYDENPNFPQGWWYPFNGTIDEVAIYNRSLNAAEILSHFQKGLLYHSSGTWNATFDAGVNATWGSISWSEELPYGEELPSNQAVETVSGGANMTGNVLLMHFDNDSSVGENDSLVYDWSGRGNNGTAYVNHSDGSIKGPNSTGKLSRAFEFDGDDYINAGNATIINNQTTIEVWFNVPNTVGIKTIVSQWIGIPTWKANNWAIAVNDDNFYSIIMNGSDEVVNPLKHVVQNVKIKSNRWYHFAFVLNASGFAEYYLDGAEVDTHNYGFTANLSKQSPQQPIVIGGTIDKFNFFNGTIDELAIFNRTLSSAEILEHYQRGALDLLARTRTSGDAVSWGSWSVWNGTNHSLSSITGRYIEVQINMTANDTTYTPILYDLTVNISSRPTNATLVIWDDTDSAAKTVNEQIKFYANYTDTNTREPINGSETYGKTSLIAGNGTAGYLEGTGNNSMFSSDLEAIVVGPDNSFLYVADVANQLIRRINLSTNTTSLVAGNGTAGYLEGTGNNSMFNGPDGLSIDSNGTFLYLSDSSNNRIRRITLSTNVTSLISGNGTEGYAEGNSTNSMFNFPLGTAIDTNGNYLYVSDFNNNRIRRIDLSTNTTSLIAGNASCDYKEGTGNNSMFCSPVGIAIDSSNTYLYISDYGNNRIRRIDLSTNKTSLIAGNGTAGYLEGTGNNSMFSSPQFISIEPSNKYLYVADSSNNRIRKIDLTTNTTSLVAGSGTATYLEDVGSGASFNSPYGVATNKNNLYLYVADTNNYRIRRIAIGPSCELSENSSGSWSSAVKMTFNTASRLYEYNTTFAAGGNFSFNATCDGSIAGYAVVDAVDDFYVKSPMVELAGPADGSTDTDGNITFICNATADRNLANISLYHNASGTFALNDTWHFGEFANDSNTLMLCHFNNNYTCTARGNGTPVTNTGTTNVFGKMNNATFIDADDVLNYNATNNFNASNGSIEMWVKPLWNGSDSTNRGFFQIKNDTNINDFKLAKYNAGGGNSLYLDMWSNGAAQTGIGYSVANWKSNEWHHIAATWETNNVILYIDGVNIGSDTSATMPTAIDIIKVGVYDDIWTANATIDEFRIYNRTLTAAEVWKSYQRRNSTAEADVNFTITSIADNKNITWNCLAYDNSSQSSWGDANWSVNVILSDITPPSINFTSPTPPNNTITANTNVQINISITNASDLAEMKLNWNGTNYTFYNNSLVLMYNFDNMSAIGDTSTVAVDVSKYSNNGTFQGAGEPAWNCTDAKYGCALQFDGSNDKIIDTTTNGLNVINMTVAAWIKPDVVGTNDMVVDVDNAAGNDGWGLRLTVFNIYDGTNAHFVAVPSGNITANRWNYFVGTYDGSTIRVYVDGIEINSTDDSFTPGYTSATPQLTIGAMYDTGTPGNYYAERYFDGLIDEVRIWNRSLTAAEIQQHYYSNLNKYDTDKWAFYTNQSNLTGGGYNYYGCAKDTAGNENCTETRALTTDITAPIINEVRCYNSTAWINCSRMAYGINLTQIRVNCTDIESNVANVSYLLTNLEDNAVKINASYVTNDGDFWYYNYSQLIQDSGNWTLNITCTDSGLLQSNYSENWSLAWGVLAPYIVTGNMEVARNVSFNFTVGVNCTVGECGSLNATLDPEEFSKLIKDYYEANTKSNSKDIAEYGIIKEKTISEKKINPMSWIYFFIIDLSNPPPLKIYNYLLNSSYNAFSEFVPYFKNKNSEAAQNPSDFAGLKKINFFGVNEK